MGASSRSITHHLPAAGDRSSACWGRSPARRRGTAISWFCDHYRLITIPMDVYQVSYLPFKLLPWDLGVVVVAAIAVCFLATLYPVAPGRQARPRPGAELRMSFVTVEGLNKSYDVAGRRLQVLRDLNLQVEQGRDGGDHGRVRRGQEHAAARPRRPRRVRQRPGPGGRPRDFDRSPTRRGWPSATGTSGSCSSSITCCRSSPRWRTRRCRCASRACRWPSRGRGRWRCSRAWGWGSGSTTVRGCSRGANNSAWRCRARS